MQKWGPNKGYNYKWHMEASNGEGPFNNVEEGPKISTFPVYSMAKQWTKTGKNKHAKMGNKHEIKKQLIAAVPKQVRALQQS